MKKYIIILLAVVAVVITYVSLKGNEMTALISPAGTTGTSGRYYSQTLSLATVSGTTTSLYNNSGYDFAIRATDVMCQGLGTSLPGYAGQSAIASLNFKFATSSTNTVTKNVSDINSNYSANINVSTTTPDSYTATSTEGILPSTTRIWPSGTYMIASANATNTASCAIGISVMPL